MTYPGGTSRAYFDTSRANNGGTEAINGLIELHRRVARGFRNRDNYDSDHSNAILNDPVGQYLEFRIQ